MNFRNKYLLNTIRILFGLVFLASGIMGFVQGPNADGIPEPMASITKNLWSAGLFQMIKVTEIVTGLMLMLNFLPALAAILIAPVSVGILVFNAMLAPIFLPIGIVIALLNAYLGYAYWDKYKVLFKHRNSTSVFTGG
ncbi:hypothetical protein COV18_05760 [Candidatus Woesearchaeota archaeon CG10_big_fil_rev_8_21_14_0_10_37_12]|nr:MAG: hypothetical protein COV18_05760 [Candidatus Woesearchaeota archaeon CG10_big_fil_rev_8_21_14_0_10_37_12]